MAKYESIYHGKALIVSLALAALFMLMPALVVGTAQRADRQAPDGGNSQLGLVGPGRYESPQFGHVVEWDVHWEPDTEATESIREIALDRLSIVAGEARFQAFHVAADGESAADYVERFFAFRMANDASMSLIASGERRGVTWAAYTFEPDGALTFGVVEISLVGPGTTIQVVEVMADHERFDQVFATAMETILVDGDDPFRILRGWPE